MNILKDTLSQEYTDFFEPRGFQVTWDFDSRTRESWYEILKDGEIVMQVQSGAPLCDLLEDLRALKAGKETCSKTNYWFVLSKENDESLIFDLV